MASVNAPIELSREIREATDEELATLWTRSTEIADARYQKDGSYPAAGVFAIRRACTDRDTGELGKQDRAFQEAVLRLLRRVRGTDKAKGAAA